MTFKKLGHGASPSELSPPLHAASQTTGDDPAFTRLVLDSTIQAFYAIDCDGTATLCNAAFLKMLGFSSAENVIGRKLHSLIHHAHPDGSPYDVADCPIYRSASSGQPAHVVNEVFFRSDGSSFPVEYRAEPLWENGVLKGAVCTFSDITERLAAEAALRQSQAAAAEALERLELALDSGAIAGTWIWNLPTDTMIGDERFARTFSLDAALLKHGVPLSYVLQSIHPEDMPSVMRTIDESMVKGGPYRAEYRVRQKSGKWLWIEANGRIEQDSDGKAIRFPGVLINIDDRKRMETVRESEIKARREAETALQKAHEQLRMAQEIGGIGAFSLDIHTDLLTVTPEFCRIFGLPILTTVKIQDIEALLLPEDSDIGSRSETRLKGTAPLEVEYRLLARDTGEMRWVARKAEFIRDSLGQPTQMIGVVQDITERKAVEKNLRDSEIRFRTLAQVIPNHIWSAQADGRLDWFNDKVYSYSGLLYEQLAGEGWAQIVHPDDLSKSLAMWQKAVASREPYETQFRLRRADGIYRWHIARALPVAENGEVVRWIGTNTDIEEQKASEDAANDAKTHLSLMVDSAKDYAIISMNERGNIISWSQGAERIFGYSPEEAIGNHITMIFTPEDCANGVPAHELELSAEQGRAQDERWHERKNGERFYVSGIMTAMYKEDRRVRGYIKIARDMTEWQKSQEALIEARNAAEAANIAKTEFLANMSHEIRTPMNAVIGLANILAASAPLTEKQSHFIRTLQSSADSLLTLINDLLDITKIEAGTVDLEIIPFSLAQVIGEIASMMSLRVREKGLTFTYDADCADRNLFMGDPTRLRQIILNLASNAVKFTEQGSIHIGVSMEPVPESKQAMICIAVTDTGIGIAPEKLDRIFQKFVQADSSISRKYGGTGLGLAITKTLASIMGGSLKVQSQIGKGSTFTACIPFEFATDTDVQDFKGVLPDIFQPGALPKPHMRILLVEDYPPNVMVATTFIESFGYACDVANSGNEAFEKIKGENYSAVLMDVQMHGMDGIEATILIRDDEKRQARHPVPIIGMTAHALAGDRERCMAAGMDDYIAKPFDPDDLQAKLQKLCRDRRGA